MQMKLNRALSQPWADDEYAIAIMAVSKINCREIDEKYEIKLEFNVGFSS